MQSSFYQWLLFNACLRSSYATDNIEYVPDLCTVTTKDNQNYTVSLNKWAIRSDWTPVSLEDVYFTYNEILRNNMWKLPLITQYSDITITKDVNNTLSFNFPKKSSDNILFFTNYILPKHILINSDLNDYTSLFAFSPVYTNCANPVSQSKDEYSLVFNLVNCNQSNLNFYQVKNMVSFDTFKDSIEKWENSIIDWYIGDETLDGYVAEKTLTNQLISVFFNTQSDTLRVRGRRALWGLIKHNFYDSGYENFFKKNDDGLFDVFQSTWSDIAYLLNREYTENLVTKDDLLDINVQALPTSISIKWDNRKSVYFIETWASVSFKLVFDKEYDKVVIEYKGKTYSPKHYTKTTKSGRFTIGTAENTFGSWLNKYNIYGYESTKKTLAASLDIYNVVPEERDEWFVWDPVKFTVIYYSDYVNDFVVSRLLRVFNEAGIGENFVFEKMKTPQELQWRLMVWDYDLLINTVDMGLKKDLTKLFSTDKSDINPSQYQNQKLTSLLTQYIAASDSGKKKPLAEINSIYSKDMPFVILGKEYLTINLKPDVAQILFATWNNVEIDQYNRRNFVYTNLKLVSNVHIDGKKVWNFDNFSDFLTNAIK